MANYLKSNLKVLRLKKGKTQKEVADELHLGERVFSYYETGKHDPNTELLVDLANYFDVSVDELLHTDLRSELDKDSCILLQNKYLNRDLLSIVKSSDIWKRYQEKTNQISETRNKLIEEHKDDEEWLDNYYWEEEMERQIRFYEQSSSPDDFETLLFEGNHGIIVPLLQYTTNIYCGTDARDSIEAIEQTYLFLEEIITYCVIAMHELTEDYEFLK